MRPDQPGRSLTDGFEDYLAPSDEEYKAALTSGLVVLDANVLLNLYRFEARARSDFIGLFKKLQARIWVPHQAAAEFWANRGDVIATRNTIPDQVLQELGTAGQHAMEAINAWARRVALSEARSDAAREAIQAGIQEATEVIREVSASDLNAEGDADGRDPILAQLAEVLDGRVGDELPAEELADAIAEGQRRVEAGRPPGYKDAAKERRGGTSYGDYLVWAQTLREAVRQGCDVLLVTGDVKEDWWLIREGKRIGPRVELAQEFRQKTGKRLLMMRPEVFLKRGSQLTGLSLGQESIAEIQRVIDLSAQGWATSQGSATLSSSVSSELSSDVEGWTADTIAELLRRLDQQAPVQASVIRAAARSGGFLPRERVYELAEYEPSRTLTAFSRPVTRVAREMGAAGLIGSEPLQVLSPVYDPTGVPGPAIGYRVPPSLLPLVRQSLEQE